MKAVLETVRQVITSYGYNSRIARRKFFVNEITSKLHLDFVKSMVDKDLSFWESVILCMNQNLTHLGLRGE